MEKHKTHQHTQHHAHHSHHHYNHNNYLKELEIVLAGVKTQLIENEQATQIDYKTCQVTERGSEHDKREKKAYYNKAQFYLKELTDLLNTSYELQLLSDKIISIATIAGNDETNVAAKVATAARSIEAALEAVQALSSLAASINAKALTDSTSKDSHEHHTKTPISKAAAEVNEKGLEASKAADSATLASLNATISAAKSNAKFQTGNITDFSSAITTLTADITQTKTDATTNATNAFSDLQAALKKASDDEKALDQAFLNWKSAQAANDEDDFKLGLIDAQKQVIEDERKAAAAAAAASANPKK